MASTKKSTSEKKEKVQKKLIIVHGWEGSPNSDWLPWLRGEMERRGWEVHVPALPNAKNPKIHEWLPALALVADKVDENTFMVGHSLGCITVLRFLENLPEEVQIGGAILVAGFDNPLNSRELEDFFAAPINWEKAKRNCKKFVSIHSEDDPVVPVDNSVRFKNKLDAKETVVSGYRHFAGEHGITSLPLVLQELLEISDRTS